MQNDKIAAVALEIAREAGQQLVSERRREIRVEHKSARELVTDCDIRCQALLFSRLTAAFPEHVLVGEEGAGQPETSSDRPTWFIDPIDGTNNFAHGLPWYCISLGLEVHGEAEVGVVIAPQPGWEFVAWKGGGAAVNGSTMTVSPVTALSQALVATGFPYDRSSFNNVDNVKAVLERAQDIRRVGVASLDCAMVAAGWMDGYWECSLKAWDVSAGALLVREAGGQVTAISGDRFSSREGTIVATNGRIHQELLDVLQSGTSLSQGPS